MSCAEGRCPGVLNSVKSASSNRTMITQRAKLRRLVFIRTSLTTAAPCRGPLSAICRGLAYRPTPANVGAEHAPAKGKGRNSGILAPFPNSALLRWRWLRGPALRLDGVLRAGSRAIATERSDSTEISMPASVRRIARPAVIATRRSCQRVSSRLSLIGLAASSPSRCPAGASAAASTRNASSSCRPIKARPSSRAGSVGVPHALAGRRGRSRHHRLAARHALREAAEPFGGQALAFEHRPGRAQAGPREGHIRVHRVFAPADIVALERRGEPGLGRGQEWPQQSDAVPRSRPGASRQARPVPIRRRAASAPSPPGRRAYGLSRRGKRRAGGRDRRAYGSGRAERPLRCRSRACGLPRPAARAAGRGALRARRRPPLPHATARAARGRRWRRQDRGRRAARPPALRQHQERGRVDTAGDGKDDTAGSREGRENIYDLAVRDWAVSSAHASVHARRPA